MAPRYDRRWRAGVMVGVSVFAAAVPLRTGGSHVAQALTLRGHVSDLVTGRSLAGATVVIEDPKLNARTDSAGRFVLRNLQPGAHRLRVYALGYESLTSEVQLRSGRDSVMEFALRPLPAQLREIVVAARMDSGVPSSLIGAYRRVEAAKGYFFTRRDLERLNPKDFQTLLNHVPTVSMNDRGVTFQRCQSGIPSPLGGNPHEQANVQLWVDGFRVSGRHPGESVVDILRTIPPTSIEVMEVYTGIARIPAEFLDDACAAIVIWTRRF